MAKFEAGQARQWAMNELKGVAGCLQPTLRHDFSGLNERAIRHDVALAKRQGYAGMLLVTEVGTTPDEMRDVVDIAVDEAGPDLITILQASEPTLEQNISLVQYAEQAGVDLVLPSYPLTFYPLSEEEVYDYTKRLADSTSLGLILFAIHLWNFGRLHPSSFSPDLIGRLIDDCPNIVAVKNEIGSPGIAGIAQVFERFSERVVVTDPFEMNAPAWARVYGMQFLGTSNYEYTGAVVPEFFSLLQEADGYEKAMEVYWNVHRARQANQQVIGEAVAGTNLVPRLVWKYQGWLSGYNGGPIRSPQGRISDAQMRTLRAGLVASGLPVPDEGDDQFFVGRNPE